jgi:hypothetical protein
LPSYWRRTERTVTPRRDISKVTSGTEAIMPVNWGPLNEPCSTGTW